MTGRTPAGVWLTVECVEDPRQDDQYWVSGVCRLTPAQIAIVAKVWNEE